MPQASVHLDALREVMRSAPSPVALTRAGDSTFVEINDEMLSILGFAREEVVGRNAMELGIWRNPPLKEIQKQLQTEGRARRLPLPFFTRSGQERHFLANLRLLVVDGEPCILTSCMDVTELRAESERIRKSEERFRKAFDDAPIGMVLFDGVGKYVQVNRAFAAMIGLPPEDFVGRDWKDFTHPDDIAPVTDRGQVVGASTRSNLVALEKRYLRPDGKTVWASLTSSALRGPDGKATEFVTQVQDITERKLAEEALRGQTMTRELVRRLLLGILHRGNVSEAVIREIGNELSREQETKTIDEALAAFHQLGFGELKLERADNSGYTFTGRDLLERRRLSQRPTCYLALSYLEGAVARVSGAPAALGSEIRCQSQGHKECSFVVVPRAKGRS